MVTGYFGAVFHTYRRAVDARRVLGGGPPVQRTITVDGHTRPIWQIPHQ